MTDVPSPLLQRLSLRTTLSAEERAAILALPRIVQTLLPGENLIREGDRPTHCGQILRGFAFRHKIVGDGARQILALQLPGDLVDLQNIIVEKSDHTVQALTHAEVALMPRVALQDLAFSHPAMGKALLMEMVIESSISREWIANIGRRPGLVRVAHLLCEFAVRLQLAGLGTSSEYVLPMTQEQLADTVGLTPIHINRLIRELDERRLIKRDKRALVILDWHSLARVADFDPAYLHLPDNVTARLMQS